MTNRYALGVAAVVLAAAAGGCGGGGGGAAGGGEVPTETRSFQFTVAVPRASATLGNPSFSQNQDLSTPGVVLASAANPSLATTTASVIDQQRVPAVPGGFQLAVHFDASGSIDDNGRDPGGDRFTAATGLLQGVANAAPGTVTRVFTFRNTYANDFLLMSPSGFPASDSGARSDALTAARNQGARDNSPALTATFNIIDQVLPPGTPHAMLLLTDGENNAESRSVVPDCQGTNENSPGTGCGNVNNVVTLANGRNVRIFVAGLGNDDQALSNFRNLANRTGAALVKATRSETLQSQFAAIGQLMVGGGVVVTGETGDVTVAQGGNPFVKGWLRFDQPSGGCPGGSQAVGTSTCRIAFGQ